MIAPPKISRSILVWCMLLLFCFTSTDIFASHLAGLHYEFECISACTTRVHFYAYRDCNGSSIISTTSINFVGIGTNCSLPVPLGSWAGPVTVEITPVCPGIQTTCASATAPVNGFEEYHFWRDYEVCSTTCNEYNLTYSTCCRPASLTNGSGNTNTFFDSTQTQVNFGLSSCNNSPVLNNGPALYICQSSNSVHNMNAIDPDGDSLSYSLGPCFQMAGTPISYATGYSATAP